jgi:arginyl-tRNA synthetase
MIFYTESKLTNISGETVSLDIPKIRNADFVCNIALKQVNQKQKPAQEIAVEYKKILQNDAKILSFFEKIEVTPQGFLEFFVSQEALFSLTKENTKNWGKGNLLEGKRIMVEFSCLNAMKPFHIGHFRNIILGESLSRILEFQEAKICRATFYGDIGMNIAKCIYGIVHTEEDLPENESLKNRMDFLGKCYAKGGTAFEENEEAKKDIQSISKNLYTGENDTHQKLFEIGRKWSFEYFETLYTTLDCHFDEYFYESESWKIGKEIVEKNIGSIFTLSNGAVVFEGEKYNPSLHTRVFINSEGNPTYETKDIGLALQQYKAFPYDTNIHVVGNEQTQYFSVVFEAQNQLFPEIKGKQYHLSYGLVKLSEGKMSSRTGKVITGEWLINEAKKLAAEIMETRNIPEKEKTIESVALGALKFALLHIQAKNDSILDLKKSVKMEGDSGPYIQYAYARIQSILDKTENLLYNEEEIQKALTSDDCMLLRRVQYFPLITARCAQEYTTHYLTHYLLKLVSEFSSWYAKHSVLQAETEELKAGRIQIIRCIQNTLKQGLYLLSINTPPTL